MIYNVFHAMFHAFPPERSQYDFASDQLV